MQDFIQPFLFEEANIRGSVVNLTTTYQTIISQRPYPDEVKKLLGEALLAAIFLASDLKFEGKLSLQFQGAEPLSLLVVQIDEKLHLRAMAKFEDKAKPEDYKQSFLQGTLALSLHSPNQSESYQSFVPINSSSMSENLMVYLKLSAQISSQVWMATSENTVAGLILEKMPDKSKEKLEELWDYALAIGQTIKAEELLTLESKVLLHRLFHEVDLRLFPSRTPKFECGCNENKMKSVIVMLGEKEAKSLVEEQSHIKISCDFCNKTYKFDAVDTAALFHPKNINRSEFIDPNIEIIKEIKPK